MKIAFLICSIATLVSIALSDSNMELNAFSRDCLAEAKVTEKEVAEFYTSDVGFNAGTANLKCHLKCVMEKLGQFKAGVLDVEKTIRDWKEIPELADYKVTDPKVFANCKNEKGANDCETAYKMNKCLRQSKAA